MLQGTDAVIVSDFIGSNWAAFVVHAKSFGYTEEQIEELNESINDG